MKKVVLLVAIIGLMSLVGCGGGDSAGPSGSGPLTGTFSGYAGWTFGFTYAHKLSWEISQEGSSVTVRSEAVDGSSAPATYNWSYDEATKRLDLSTPNPEMYYIVSDTYDVITPGGPGAFGAMYRN